jgi:peptide chain release factor 2
MLALLGRPEDGRAARVTIQAGAGGIEAEAWAEMLLGIYQRWAARHGLTAREVERHSGGETGIRAATLDIHGAYVYGRLRSEHGVHRMVRVSPFDAAGRRHMAFAMVTVQPLDASGTPGRGGEVAPEQIRTWVFHPEPMVTDHRTGAEVADVEALLDGGVDPFIEAYLRQAGGPGGM